MSFWVGLKNFFTITPKVADDVFDKDNGLLVKTGRWIDGLQYTAQEKAENFKELIGAYNEFFKTSLNESTERSLTRRSISVLWIKVELGLILMTAIAIPCDSILGTNMKKDFFELATCDVMVWGTGAVIGFFLGPYMWGAHIKRNGGTKKE
ncbi:MAG: hypothetical protein ACFFCW_00440 [Candidatus Hodarchaeota archaeon]